MSYVNPALREQFEQIPIDIKNRILEANVNIENTEDLQLSVDLIQKQESCCGDL